jgi:AcrR family transcriptional regulator
VAVKTLRERQAEATRQLLVSVARELFTEKGYAATSIEEIIKGAGVARGALYHHFAGKDALFRAVYDEVQAEVAARVVATAVSADDPWDGVRAGLEAFLDACLEPAFRRIVIMDSVPVLSQDVWDGGIEHNELPMLRSVLTPLVEASLPGVAVEPLVHVALGGLYGAALYIARAPDPKTARADANTVLDVLIGGVRSRMEDAGS